MEWSLFYLNEASSPCMEQMSEFHEHAMLVMIFIFSFITLMLIYVVEEKNLNKNFLHQETLEIFWTIAPIIMLLFLAFPSLQVLYMIEESLNSVLTIKIIGHQWYWSYEYENFNVLFDSFMDTNTNSIFRLLDVDKALVLPYWTQIRLLITSEDVIHSWTVPVLGIKMDAVPGRLNSSAIFSFRSGWAYGQCSEICGVNHSFMPIKIDFVPVNKFISWMFTG